MNRVVPVPFILNKPQWLTDVILADIKVEVFCRLDRIFKDLISLDASIEIGTQFNQQIVFKIETWYEEKDMLEIVYNAAQRFFGEVLREKCEAMGRSIHGRGNLDKISNLLIK